MPRATGSASAPDRFPAERQACVGEGEERHDGEDHPGVQRVLQLVQGRLQFAGGAVERVQGGLAFLVAQNVGPLVPGVLEAVEDVPAALQEIRPCR